MKPFFSINTWEKSLGEGDIIDIVKNSVIVAEGKLHCSNLDGTRDIARDNYNHSSRNVFKSRPCVVRGDIWSEKKSIILTVSLAKPRYNAEWVLKIMFCLFMETSFVFCENVLKWRNRCLVVNCVFCKFSSYCQYIFITHSVLKYMGELCIIIAVLFILYFLYWILRCENAGKLLLKLLAPHERLIGLIYLIYTVCKIFVPTSQIVHCVVIIKVTLLMLRTEIVAVFCEHCTQLSPPYGHNTEIWIFGKVVRTVTTVLSRGFSLCGETTVQTLLDRCNFKLKSKTN